MALASTTIWETRTGGSDTICGGAFDPGQSAGMFTDGAATSATGTAPVFTSASYNFAAGDVNAYVFIRSGTNWTPGWYLIASVASNAATLTATIGFVPLYVSTGPPSVAMNTAAGCATTASPTGATWTIDYSQQNTAQFAYTDLASVGAGLLVSSVAFPFGKQQVGNSLIITGGTNFTAGTYVIASVAASVATVVGAANITTGAGVSGTGNQGGACASPGKVAGVSVLGNTRFIKYNASVYPIASTTANIATGKINFTESGSDTVPSYWIGYDTNRHVLNTDANRPTLQVAASGVTSINVFAVSPSGTLGNLFIRNIIIDGNAKSSITGWMFTGGASAVYVFNCDGINCTNSGFSLLGGNPVIVGCYTTGCSTVAAFTIGAGMAFGCLAKSNTITGFSISGGASGVWCIADSNSGASSDGFNLSSGSVLNRYLNCVAYNNGRDGFRSSSANARGPFQINCIGYGNAGWGFNNANGSPVFSLNCAGGSNTSGNESGVTISMGFITLTADPFTAKGSGDFSLNTTAGGGTACRAAGYPGAYSGATTTGKLDVGAAQHADPASSGGTSAYGRSLF